MNQVSNQSPIPPQEELQEAWPGDSADCPGSEQDADRSSLRECASSLTQPTHAFFSSTMPCTETHAVAPTIEVISMPLAAFIDIHFAKQRPRERASLAD